MEEEKARWEAKASWACVVLIAFWVWFTGLNSSIGEAVGFSLFIGCGIGFGISAFRHGGPFSRGLAWSALSLHLTAAGLLIVEAVRNRWLR
jgi:hypothetical protein